MVSREEGEVMVLGPEAEPGNKPLKAELGSFGRYGQRDDDEEENAGHERSKNRYALALLQKFYFG